MISVGGILVVRTMLSQYTEPFRIIWKHRRLLALTTASDIKTRFAGSILGLAWILLYPLLLLGAYAFIYIFVFKVRLNIDTEPIDFVIMIFCGLIPFLGIAEALGLGVPSVTNNASLIKNTLFPIELIPIKAVLTSQCTQVGGLFLLILTLAILGKLTLFSLLVVPIWLLNIMISVGVVWVLSSANVYLRDLQNMVAIMTLILMMVSPIAYTEEMVPEKMRIVLYFNPLYYLISSYRDVLMHGKFPEWRIFGIYAISSLTIFFAGYNFFSRMKKVFTDNV